MALVVTREEQREALNFLYKKYGRSPFQYNDVREHIPKKMFSKFCVNKFIIKDKPSELIRLVSGDKNKVLVNNWKLNMYFVGGYIE
jgi:hypothetical protein